MAEVLLAPRFLVLYGWIACALYVHFRGRVRHRFGRQLTDHSSFLAPYNVLVYLFSGVPRGPILDPRTLPELAPLQKNWRIIRDEAQRLFQAGRIRAAEDGKDIAFNTFFRRGWKRFHLRWYGEVLPSARELCPETCRLVESIPSVNAALFALMAPKSVLGPHRDPFAGSLRYHLGLATPNSNACRIHVDGNEYSWRDGEDVLFDETYIHRAINEADSNRIILFADIERPMRYRWATAANRWIGRVFVRATETKNQEGDHVGFANRLFKYVYQVRLVGKRLKKKNRKLYYVVKYIVFGGILVWIFA